MGGYEIALVLIGGLCGNLGAVLVPAFNLGLFWNTVLGAAGALAAHFGTGDLVAVHALSALDRWPYGFLFAALSGTGAMLLIGGLVALAYRD